MSLFNSLSSVFGPYANRINTLKDMLRLQHDKDHALFTVTSVNLFDKNDCESGGISNTGAEIEGPTAMRTITPVPLSFDTTSVIANIPVRYVFFNKKMSFISRSASTGNAVDVPSGSAYVRFTLSKSYYDNTENIMVNVGTTRLDYQAFELKAKLNDDVSLESNTYLNSEIANIENTIDNVTENVVPEQIDTKINSFLKTQKAGNLFNKEGIELGAISSSGNDSSSTTTYRTNYYESVISRSIIGNVSFWVYCYDTSKAFLGRNNTNPNTLYTMPEGTAYVRFVISKANIESLKDYIMIVNASTLPRGYVKYSYKYFVDGIQDIDKYHVVGRNFLVYKFGGDGNDWCFVRTPADYDPNREKPYPFVICNHGNGTTMDGTGFNANWTPHTMYLDPDDPNFDTAYDMIATTDPELQYSNPVMEKFLENGYIVCGCENYGDGLYGNENCRKACVDFYNHMIKRYNVPDYCYMIGASNGAQTTINASYLLGSRVRAIVLQYPLACLILHYYEKESHQAPIRTAYGITNSSPTEADLIQGTLTHDVLHTNIIDGKIAGYFPACKVYYSYGDTMTAPDNNAIPLMQLLTASSKIVEGVECTGGHGSASHFDPDGFYDFISTH